MDLHWTFAICRACRRQLTTRLTSRRAASRNIRREQPTARMAGNESNADDDSNGRGLKVAVIGCPNVGKSALTNALIRANVCAVSRQVDTTRYNTTTALTEEDCQLVVVDSPGLIGTKHAKDMIGAHSDARILVDPEEAIRYAGHVLVVQDVSLPGQYIQHRVLHLLHRYAHIPSSLVLNKVDLMPRRADLLHLAAVLTEGVVNGEPIQRKLTHGFGRIDRIIGVDKKSDANPSKAEERFGIHHTSSIANRDEKWHALYNTLLQKPAHKCSWSDTRRLYMGQNGWPAFVGVFFVSCTTGEGIDALRDHLKRVAQPSDWRYDAQTVSRKNPQKICLEHVRSKFLDLLPAHVAYALNIYMCEWEMNEFGERGTKTLRTIIDVNCMKEREARLAQRVAARVEFDVIEMLRALFHIHIQLRLHVKHNGRLYLKQQPKANEDANGMPKSQTSPMAA